MRLVLLLLLWLCGGAALAQDQPRVLDGFEDVSAWEARASDGVLSRARPAEGRTGQALQLDFDFQGVSGYAFVRRDLPIEFPENYEISFWLKADAPVNTFEVKFVDASGDNVWWRQRRDHAFPTEWTRYVIKKRHIDLAWGPTTDRTLRRSASVEFVVVRGQGGGKGTLVIDDLTIRELPPEPATPPRPLAQAGDGIAARAVDGDRATAWRAGAGARSLTLDLGYLREFGGVELHWAPNAHASDYRISASEDGSAWRTLRSVRGGDGGRDPLMLPEAEARYLRLDLERGAGRGYGLLEVEVEPLAFGASPTAFIEAVARDAPRGVWPRGFVEQPYWTLVGVDGGSESGLLSEDGALELKRGGASIEPFIVERDPRARSRLITWADATVSQRLQDGYLPIPSVTWEAKELRLTVTAFAEGDRADSRLVARYDLANLTRKRKRLTFALMARPLQVNGPKQFLTTPGGVSPIRSLAFGAAGLRINDALAVVPLEPPARFTAATFDAGAAPGDLLLQDREAATEVTDETGLAAGALRYEIELGPGETRSFGIVAPLSGHVADLPASGTAAAWLDARQRTVADVWRAKLDRVQFTVPDAGRRVVDTLRTSLAHILMSRNGPILKPGTRSYDRSWVRDGAMIAESLVRLGNAEIAADYLHWYAPFQFENGKVPCCVDTRGADPTPENDSHGELIFLAAEVYRYTGDRALLRSVWPQVQAAARYMDELRASEQARNAAPDRRHLYGLLPPSISHEGYSAKPAYSYWDNFWGLLGYTDAVFIAETLGEREAAAQLTRSRDEFRRDLYASIAAMPRVHGVPFIPGAADLGDFDATSTTIALAPGGEQAHLPPAQLEATFERYWRDFVRRRDGQLSWETYTPYELRTVGAFVRLGRPDRAHAALDFFFGDRRPQAWNGWAEVVGREPRKPVFLGDVPHAWVSSDYIRSALDLFAYDRESDRSIIIAAGVPEDWTAGAGVAVRGLRTPYGPLSYTARRIGGELALNVEPGAQPPGGFIYRWTGAGVPPAATQNGRALPWRDGELRIVTPGEVRIRAQ